MGAYCSQPAAYWADTVRPVEAYLEGREPPAEYTIAVGNNTAEAAAPAAAAAAMGVCTAAVAVVILKAGWIHSYHRPDYRRGLLHRTGDS